MILCKSKLICFFAGLLIVLSQFAWSATRAVRTTEGTNAPSPAVAAKEQLRKEAQQSHKGVKDLLTQVLGIVQANQRPSGELVEQCRAALETNKQNALAYEDAQRADYMLLYAWTGFFEGNMVDAVNWSLKACRQYEPGQDAWISQAFFNMLSGKRPIEPRIEKPTPEPQRSRQVTYRPRRNAEVAVAETKPEPYSEKGVLDFDLFALRPEFFRERYERLECVSTSGQTVQYVPGQNWMCLFFYQTQQQQPVQAAPEQTGDLQGVPMNMALTVPETADAPLLGLEPQREYFTKLMEACGDIESIKFWQVDTVRPKDLQSLQISDSANSQIPTLVPSDPKSNARQLACDGGNPFMMIVDKEGTVRYAGPAGYFMPAMILSETTGENIALQQTTSGDLFSQSNVWTSTSDPNLPAVDPNAPQTAAPQTTAPAPSSPFGSEQDMPFEETEQQLSAENLLRMAQLKIEESRTVRGSNPGEGIKACRQILEKYPDTPYAQQARELLRRVPARYKESYNITDEELGL